MLTEEDLPRLLTVRSESKNLDYKERFNWKTGDLDEKLEIVKDILAMSNTQDGGKLVFGVRDGDFEPIGLSQEDFESFDQTRMNDFLHKYTDPKHSCQVCKMTREGKRFVIIDVPEFTEIPVICKREAHSSSDTSKLILKKGQIYIRTDRGSSEAVPGAIEMRELVGRAFVKKRDEVLSYISGVMMGKPSGPSDLSLEKYKEEILQADEFFSETIEPLIKGHGYWRVLAYPIDYHSMRIRDPREIKTAVEKSGVASRGWLFPCTDMQGRLGTASYFGNGRQFHTVSEDQVEGYRAYQSSLFIWWGAMREDQRGYEEDGRRVLSFPGAIMAVMEFLTFFKRYFERLTPEGTLQLRMSLFGTEGRQLVSLNTFVRLYGPYISRVKSINVKETTGVPELAASLDEVANRLVREIFLLFNWESATKELIQDWQSKLREQYRLSY